MASTHAEMERFRFVPILDQQLDTASRAPTCPQGRSKAHKTLHTYRICEKRNSNIFLPPSFGQKSK